MVLVDTSVWIALYRKQQEALGQRIWMLAARNEAAVCGHVWVEFLGGFRKERERRSYADRLRAFPFLDTPGDAYALAADLLSAHPRLGSGDAIIAATAIAAGAALWTLDGDFEPLQQRGLRLY